MNAFSLAEFLAEERSPMADLCEWPGRMRGSGIDVPLLPMSAFGFP